MPWQVDLFDEAELAVPLCDLEAQIPAEVLAKAKRKAPSREFSDKLPRVRVEHRLSDDEKAGASRTFFVRPRKNWILSRRRRGS